MPLHQSECDIALLIVRLTNNSALSISESGQEFPKLAVLQYPIDVFKVFLLKGCSLLIPPL